MKPEDVINKFSKQRALAHAKATAFHQSKKRHRFWHVIRIPVLAVLFAVVGFVCLALYFAGGSLR